LKNSSPFVLGPHLIVSEGKQPTDFLKKFLYFFWGVDSGCPTCPARILTNNMKSIHENQPLVAVRVLHPVGLELHCGFLSSVATVKIKRYGRAIFFRQKWCPKVPKSAFRRTVLGCASLSSRNPFTNSRVFFLRQFLVHFLTNSYNFLHCLLCHVSV
jgi:hypothetical protein